MTQKKHASKLHAKLRHTGKDRIHANTKHLNYITKGRLDIFEECAMVKRNQKLLHKVADKRNLKPGESIYLDIISQKKPSYGGFKNCILIQDSYIKQKWSFFKKEDEYLP